MMKDEQTEALKRFNDEQAKIVAEYVQKSNIAELEKLKAEILEENRFIWYSVDIKDCIDKHISKLQGEINNDNRNSK